MRRLPLGASCRHSVIQGHCTIITCCHDISLSPCSHAGAVPPRDGPGASLWPQPLLLLHPLLVELLQVLLWPCSYENKRARHASCSNRSPVWQELRSLYRVPWCMLLVLRCNAQLHRMEVTARGLPRPSNR